MDSTVNESTGPQLSPATELPPYLPLRLVVLDRLRDAIQDGTLKPGLVLSENKLAAQLEVSRTPVREALRALEQENLVTVLSGRKLVVTTPTLRDIEEIYGIRYIVESEAVRRVAADDGTLMDRLELCVCQARYALEHEDAQGLTESNAEFHRTLVANLDNLRLHRFIDSVNDLITRFRQFSLQDEGWARRAADEHSSLLALLREGRNDDAVAMLRDHLASAEALLKRKFHEAGCGDAPSP